MEKTILNTIKRVKKDFPCHFSLNNANDFMENKSDKSHSVVVHTNSKIGELA